MVKRGNFNFILAFKRENMGTLTRYGFQLFKREDECPHCCPPGPPAQSPLSSHGEVHSAGASVSAIPVQRTSGTGLAVHRTVCKSEVS